MFFLEENVICFGIYYIVFFLLGSVKVKLYLKALLIAVEGAKTPAGLAGQMRPRRSEATRRLIASPAESEAPGTEINSLGSRALQLRMEGIGWLSIGKRLCL